METIIVEITLGLTGETFDFMLPAHVALGAIIHEMIRKIEIYHGGIMLDKRCPMLLSEDRKSLSMDATLAMSGIRDGSRLTLV